MTGQQLRNSILQEAIHCRLVPNNLQPGEKSARELLEAYLDQCPYNTYIDAYYWLNNLESSEEIQSLYRSVREDDMYGIPFEQSRFYNEWPNLYKKYSRK